MPSHLVKYASLRYEDYTRLERASLLLTNSTAYMALLGPHQLYLLLDGLAKTEAYVPEPEEEETWRTLLRKQHYR